MQRLCVSVNTCVCVSCCSSVFLQISVCPRVFSKKSPCPRQAARFVHDKTVYFIITAKRLLPVQRQKEVPLVLLFSCFKHACRESGGTTTSMFVSRLKEKGGFGSYIHVFQMIVDWSRLKWSTPSLWRASHFVFQIEINVAVLGLQRINPNRFKWSSTKGEQMFLILFFF